MSDPFVFPASVESGSPFATVEDACDWLNGACDGIHGDPPANFAMYDSHGGAGTKVPAWTPAPLYASRAPDTLTEASLEPYTAHGGAPVSVEAVTTGFEQAAITNHHHGLIHLDDGTTLGFLLPPGREWLTPTVLIGQFRVLRGWEIIARRQFDLAGYTERQKHAKHLGGFERALDTAAESFVIAANRWITTVWVDALNDGLNVVPNLGGRSTSGVRRLSAVGIPRIGVN